ncbi:FAD-dependent oxidoreductase [Streptomyces sp. BA2]|uniref:FAD-dependent oxidoreductase n=1 Tax=Streptomyces sp. BA2 TaxID=436595 RepID=UPI001371D1AD
MHHQLPDGEHDFVVVGGGAAGLACALALSRRGSVRLLVKSALGDGCTTIAQGNRGSSDTRRQLRQPSERHSHRGMQPERRGRRPCHH